MSRTITNHERKRRRGRKRQETNALNSEARATAMAGMVSANWARQLYGMPIISRAVSPNATYFWNEDTLSSGSGNVPVN